MDPQDLNKLYMFDLDGTLLNTSNLIIKTLMNTIKIYSSIKVDTEKLRYLSKSSPYKIIQQFTGYGDMKKKMRKYWDYYDENIYTEVKVFPNIFKMLKYLKEDHYGIAIVTSLIRDRAKRLIDHYLKIKFDVIVTYQDTTEHKPHPEPIILTIEKYKNIYQIEKLSAIYIGDTRKDILAGKNANIFTGLAAWGLNDNDIIKIQDLIPNHIINDPLDLLKIKI